MRRRHRRLVEEAIRNGTYVPPERAKKKKQLGPKPRLYDAYLLNDDEEVSGMEEDEKAQGIREFEVKLGWEDIQVRSRSPSDTV